MKNLKLVVLLLIFCQVNSSAQYTVQTSADFPAIKTAEKISLFEKVYELNGVPEIEINTNINRLVRKKLLEEYQEASIKIADDSAVEVFSMDGRIRARGNYRKKVSYFPPVKIDFNKGSLDSIGLLKLDKLKLVFPANSDKYNRERLFKEFFLYQVYELIDPNAIRTKLINVSIIHKGKQKHQIPAFLIEDEKEYEKRKSAKIVERELFKEVFLEREPFLKMIFFQYMIANTDWSVGNLHNLEMVKLPKHNKVVAIPYDFDFSGFVGHNYAAPSPKLPIESVHERYFFSGYKISEHEYDQMVEYYLSIEPQLYQLCDAATYMKEQSRAECKKYLKSFFDLIRIESAIKYDIVKN